VTATRYQFKYAADCANGGAAGGAPVTGFAAWFSADMLVFQDAAGTVPAVVDGDPVMRWDSMNGSYGVLACTTPGGYGACTLKLAGNGIGGRAVIRSSAAAFGLLADVAADTGIFEGGILNSSQCLLRHLFRTSSDLVATWGDGGGYIESQNQLAMGMVSFIYDGASKVAAKPYTPGASAIHTWHHAAGVLYSGVSDTRFASMGSVAAGSIDPGASRLVILGGPGPGQYLDGDVAELIFYPVALSEADRKVTETYLAQKYGITLPY